MREYLMLLVTQPANDFSMTFLFYVSFVALAAFFILILSNHSFNYDNCVC